MIKQSKTLLNIFLIWVVLIIVATAFLFGSITHIRNNLTNISDNHPITWLQSQNVLHAKNKHAMVIFYRDNCPHCQKMIPYVYFLNHFSHQKIQYRDLNYRENDKIGGQVGDKLFPENKIISSNYGKITAKKVDLVQSPFGFKGFLVFLYVILGILSILIMTVTRYLQRKFK